jgi:hypothetical protein
MRRHRHLEIWARHALEAVTWASLPAILALGYSAGICAAVAAWLGLSLTWAALAVLAVWAEGL